VAAGGAALARGEWAQARAAFEAALADGEAPEALEGLGRACWWLDDVEASGEACERAYALYREEGDARGAARLACQLARQAAVFRGEPAVAGGWTQRARRLLSELEPCPEQAMLAVHEAFVAFVFENDPGTARERALFAGQLERRLGLTDLEMVALAPEGVSLVAEGEVSLGMQMLD
jgi:tetratricopeptide (TPR) repeat protein